MSEVNVLKKKIFIITQPEVVNTVGGAITVFVNYCNMLIENGFDVYGICFNKIKGTPQNLNEKVKFINLYGYNEVSTFSEALNQKIEECSPNLLVFFFHYLYIDAQLLSKFDCIPRILMFHSRPDFYFSIQQGSEKKLQQLYTNTVSQILFGSYRNLLPDFIKKEKVVCIPNCVEKQENTIDIDFEKKKIIFLSRIDKCKGVDFLVKSFSLIATKYKDWQIDIYGQIQPVEYEKELTVLVGKLHLEDQIHFKGISNIPLQTFLNYDFCVFPSYFEGFPMGLIEAQSVGLPCIGLEKCSGVNELIIDKYNGFLSKKSYRSFARRIEVLITNKELRKNFSKNTLESTKKYDAVLVKKQWVDLINHVLQNLSYENYLNDETETKPLFQISKIVKKFSSVRRKRSRLVRVFINIVCFFIWNSSKRKSFRRKYIK